MALACNIGERKIPAKRQGTDGRAFARARARLPGKYLLGIHVRNQVFVNEEGYPHFRLIRTLVVLVVLAAEQVLLRSHLQRLMALASKS